MSGETTMYALKPIVSLPCTVHHTKTMYKMRNIYEERSRDDHKDAVNEIVPDITEQVISFLKSPLPEFSALEVRQEKILTQLADLKKQVSTLRDFLKQTNQSTVAENCQEQEPVNIHLVINANPEEPPYSILALQKLWKDTEIRIQTYVHSSTNKEGPVVYQSNTSPKRNVINITLIWKKVEDLELVLGLRDYCIIGEVNVLRYISRSIQSHSYENPVNLAQLNTTDLILDLCYSIHYQKSLKEKQEILSLISNKLDTNQIQKAGPTVADIAVWSIIKQMFPKKCPAKLNSWFEKCEKLFI